MQALMLSPDNGDGVKLVSDYPQPQVPANEALVAVRLAGVCATDLELARGYMGFAGVPGHEFVGTVVEGPADLVDQRIVGEINCACGKCDMCQRGWPTHCRYRTVLGIQGRDGAFAEYLTLPHENLHLVPDAITDEQAVFVEPIAAACEVLAEVPIAARDRVAVLGSGRLGLLIAQVVATTGCDLTVIGRNPRTLGIAEGFGLRTAHIDDPPAPQSLDVVIEATGVPAGLEMAMALVRPRSTIVLKSTYAGAAGVDLAPIVINELRVVGNRCGPFPEALRLLAAGAVRTQELIAAEYPLSAGVEAMRAAAQPENTKVLIRPEPS